MKKFFLILAVILVSCSPSSKQEVTLLDATVETLLSADATIEYLTKKEYLITEGPVWNPEENGLLFTDVGTNKMYLWQEGKGVRVYMNPSGYTAYAPTSENGQNGANGVILYGGQILLCQHGDRRVAYVASTEGTTANFKTVVDNYQGKRFNSPNDLTASRMGDIYFTDPPYGFFNNKTQTFEEEGYRELPFNGIYRYSASGELSLISDILSRPNGIALSLDEKYLYVNNSDSFYPVIMQYEVNNDWKPSVFFDGTELSKSYEGAFDGLKVHSSGTIFTTAPNGILVLSPKGELRATINFDKAITNCAFDSNEEYLYVTTFDRLARIKLQP